MEKKRRPWGRWARLLLSGAGLPASAANSTFTGDVASITTAGVLTLTATILDANSDPVVGRWVTVTVAPSTGVTCAPQTTNGSGVAVLTLTCSDVAAGKVATATVGGVSVTQTVTFEVTAAADTVWAETVWAPGSLPQSVWAAGVWEGMT
jgi:hypothetical protein